MTRAMIFAAGFGTRMGALTETLPKPMLPLAGKPMIDHTVRHLKKAGITAIVANTHYLADRIAPHLASLGVKICHEDPILETGGGLRAALPLLDNEPVITMNPDVVWIGPNPVNELLSQWRDHMQALLMLTPSPEQKDGDDFALSNGALIRSGPYRYTGLQMLRTDRLVEITEQAFSLNVYWDLLAQSGPLHGCVYTGVWGDVGSPEGLIAAEKMLVP